MKEENQNKKLCTDIVFRSVFDSNFKVLRNFLVYKFRGDIESAEDIAQNAFVKLWENCAIIQPEQAKSFLYTTAIRISLNTIKHNHVVSNFELQFKPKSSHKESPEFLMEETELKTQLEKAINDLPEKQRTVFLMNRLENQSYPEIAASLDLSVKAIEKRMHQALMSLRKVVNNV
jgi:RNA polymerase sigma-70 factor (ECF subfamily)